MVVGLRRIEHGWGIHINVHWCLLPGTRSSNSTGGGTKRANRRQTRGHRAVHTIGTDAATTTSAHSESVRLVNLLLLLVYRVARERAAILIRRLAHVAIGAAHLRLTPCTSAAGGS